MTVRRLAVGAVLAALLAGCAGVVPIQPGSSVAQKPKVYAKEYFVVGPESIVFSKYQNEWVEVTGTITEVASGTPATGGEKAATPPLSTVTVTAIKMISTECK